MLAVKCVPHGMWEGEKCKAQCAGHDIRMVHASSHTCHHDATCNEHMYVQIPQSHLKPPLVFRICVIPIKGGPPSRGQPPCHLDTSLTIF